MRPSGLTLLVAQYKILSGAVAAVVHVLRNFKFCSKDLIFFNFEKLKKTFLRRKLRGAWCMLVI
jgi:hypothetical protein